MAQNRQSQESNTGLLTQWRQNRIGFAGLVLSLLQLLLHGTWIGISETLAATGGADQLSGTSWQAWLIVVVLILAGGCNMLALFLSLRGSLQGHPRTPALIGLALSFFTGTLITFVIVLSAIAQGAAG